jgi:predicted naringenin-chalcone synthase
MSLTIQGLGTALPPERITQGDAAAIAAEVALPQQTPSPGQRRLLETLHRRSGVASRHSVLLQPAGSEVCLSEREEEVLRCLVDPLVDRARNAVRGGTARRPPTRADRLTPGRAGP